LKYLIIVCLAVALAACSAPAPESTTIVGAGLFDGTGADPIDYSVVVVEGRRIRAAGTQAHTPVPAGSRKWSGLGKYVMPALVPAPEAIPMIETVADLETALDRGVKAVRGIPAGSLPPELVERLKAAGTVVVPQAGAPRDNVRKLIAAGVLLAIFDGAGAVQAIQTLRDAGIPPKELLLALTRNAATAAGMAEQAGQIREGLPADLLVLAGNPMERPEVVERPERVMRDGEWREEPRP
jgi:imidazolonepropionase-like amidohydrolase